MCAVFALLVLVEGHILAFFAFRVYSQEAGQVAAAIAVIGSRPHRHDVPVVEKLLVSLLYQLMRPGDQRQAVVLVELVHHSRPEQPSHSAVVLRPPLDLLRIRPHQVSEWPLCWDLLQTVNLADLVQGVDIR